MAGDRNADTSIHFREGTNCPPPMPVVKEEEEEEDRRLLTCEKSGTWCFVVPPAHFIGRRHAKIIGLVSFFIGGPPPSFLCVHLALAHVRRRYPRQGNFSPALPLSSLCLSGFVGANVSFPWITLCI